MGVRETSRKLSWELQAIRKAVTLELDSAEADEQQTPAAETLGGSDASPSSPSRSALGTEVEDTSARSIVVRQPSVSSANSVLSAVQEIADDTPLRSACRPGFEACRCQ